MITRRSVLGAAVGATALATFGWEQSASAHWYRPGPLVLVGGGLADDNTQIYGEIVRAAGGRHARIGVLTAASIPASQDPDAGTPDANNSEFNGTYYADLLRSHGAGEAVWIPVDLDHIAAADDASVASLVDGCTGFFFGGGDQFRYVTTLLHGDAATDSLVLQAIRRRHAQGAVIAGSSAGAQIQQGPDMVTGGESYNALRDGSAPGYFDDPDASGYWPAGGFGFLTSGLIDTHFSAYARLGRAITLARTTGHQRVYGLDPNTALVVAQPCTPLESARVIGEGGVSVLDLRDGVRWSYLRDGWGYRPLTWHIDLPTGARRLEPADPVAPSSADVFADGEPTRLALALAASTVDSARGVTRQSSPQFEVVLGKGRGYRGYQNNAVVGFVDMTVRTRQL